MPATDEPDRSSMPPQEAEDQPPPSTNKAPAAQIDVHFDPNTTPITTTQLNTLREQTNRVLALIPNTGSIRVRIVNDEDMIDAHKRFSGIDSTTDVLTFDLASHDTDYNNKALDTDLIVCADEARRQASQRNHPVTHELLLYIVHGVLHCLGYDDHDQDDYERMHAREDELLNAAGIGTVFHSTNDKGHKS